MEKKEKKRVYSSRRNKYRKLKIALLYTLMILAILAAGIAIGVTLLFKIGTIQVAGESRYDPQEIIALSGIEKGENLLSVDTEEGEKAILNQLPYLETVQIHRQLPSSISIEITEARAAACLPYQKEYAVISGTGQVLELSQGPMAGIPVVKGAIVKEARPSQRILIEDEALLTLFMDLEAARAAAGLTGITEFDLTDPISPTLTYDGRIIIKLGIPTDLEYKLETAAAVLKEESMAGSQKGTLDVSLASDKGRSYFKPDYSSSSRPVSSSVSSREPEPDPEPAPEPIPEVPEPEVPEPEVSSDPAQEDGEELLPEENGQPPESNGEPEVSQEPDSGDEAGTASEGGGETPPEEESPEDAGAPVSESVSETGTASEEEMDQAAGEVPENNEPQA